MRAPGAQRQHAISTTMEHMKTQGRIQTGAGEVFWEQRGDGPGTPLVCVHGGPGFTAHYLEPLFDLADDAPVILYDQAGCGRSRTAGQRRAFSLASFVDELEDLRCALGIGQMALLGHSFGGAIAGEYALAHPSRVSRIIFACVSIDIPRWVADGERLVSKLPLMTRMILGEGKRGGDIDSPAYQGALAEYYARHVYGVSPLPDSIIRSISESDPLTYSVAWGPNELTVTGLASGYSLSPRLGEIPCPSLFVCGRNDEATPEAHEFFASQAPGARCVIFEESAHHPQITERERFVKTVRDFLAEPAR